MCRIIFALLALGSLVFAQNATSPVFGWRQAKDTAFELDPSQYRIVARAMNRPVRIQIQVEADTGIFIASMPAALIQARRMNFTSNDFARANCGQTGIIKNTYQCIMRQGEQLLLRDKRGLGSAIGTVAGAMTHNGNMIDRTTKPNKVNLMISVWACTENCTSK